MHEPSPPGGPERLPVPCSDPSAPPAARERCAAARAALDSVHGELRDAVAELTEARAQLQHLLDASPAVTYALRLEPDPVARWVSANIERVMGYAVEDALAPGWWAARVHPDDVPRMDPELADLLRAGEIAREYRFRAADGSWRWIRDSQRLVRDAAGRPAEVVGSWLDVTERRAADEALLESEARFRELERSVDEVFWLHDVEAGRTLYVSPRFEDVWGTTVEALYADPRAWARALHPEDRERVLAFMDAERTREYEVEYRIVRPDGELRFLRDRGYPIRDPDGRVRRTAGIAVDVTETVLRERHLRRVERLASLGTLIGGVAHELNNPLHAIRSFADLLLLEPRGADDLEALTVIRREADRAARVVADLRLIARETQDGGARTGVDVNAVVRHVLRVRRYALETGNVEVVEDLAAGLPPVLARGSDLEQVLLNLVVNAEQAMDGRPARRLTVRTRRTRDGVVLSVGDTGCGIPPEDRERIFDPFFTTKAPGEGTGLGLSLVHSVVAEHGGAVHVESEPGAGATFRVVLPRTHAADAEPAPERAATAPAHRLRVLVVDDEDGVRRVAQRWLERRGHVVDTAAEGAEALRLLAAADYDAILSDLRMPGLGGEELLLRLREEGRGRDRRLVFVTGDAASAAAARVVAESSVPVLVKPVRLEELSAVVESLAPRSPAVLSLP